MSGDLIKIVATDNECADPSPESPGAQSETPLTGRRPRPRRASGDRRPWPPSGSATLATCWPRPDNTVSSIARLLASAEPPSASTSPRSLPGTQPPLCLPDRS